jgi:hypothetical protein
MKQFFSIRIEWNPADSKEESHRDCFSTKRSVARQVNPFCEWSPDDKKCKDLFREDVHNVVRTITDCITELSREAKWTLPGLVEDIIFELANEGVLEEQALRLAEIAIDEGSTEFIDALQKLIDNERKSQAQP